MDITINNITVTLQKKDRTIGSEAPAIRVKMLNGETKVIGMMADSVQVMISLPFPNSLSDQLETIISKHNKSSNIYIISSKKLQKNTDTSFSSTEFKDYAL
ncbi:MAG: hypothetical protein U9Q33_02715, partial [Campylobacterota bacterium]|nr:hypothetical protein [Campylobacterota bacterium]